ncbi:MAG TPA: NAD(P)/FAD-dependent oxidoreductase [Clostridia bacterium]|jgi:prolycopene isomerase|nr:MAG: putative succinate dehydrogenase [Firmicutes bacterium ADurb.Bin146]HOD93433.1 NAD(P)/FAD-dependent oxidoreductase [Clostridia bacterium]HQM39667.1 NAD(P)/FAD-dependent oxidoreductase [Clostridia bacterium]
MSGYKFSREYDVIVIGAGNGGLTAGAVCAKKGLKTLVLEQHNLPGGVATSFVRGRFEFEPSLHEISDFGPEDNAGAVRNLLENTLELGAQWIRVPEAYRLIIPKEKNGRLDVCMPFGVEAYIDKIESEDPGCRPYVEDFIALCKEVVEAFAYMAASKGNVDRKYMQSNFGNFLRTASYSLQSVFDAVKVPYKSQKIISAYWCYLGLDVDKLNFPTYAAMFYKYLSKGAYIPRFRSHGFTVALDKKIRDFGGTIEYRTKVVNILVEHNQVIGVKTEYGEYIKTSNIIANTNAHNVYGKLVNKPDVPEMAIKACNSRDIGPSVLVAYLGLNKSAEDLGIHEYSYFIYSKPTTAEIYKGFCSFEDPVGQATVCLNNAIPDCSPPGTSILYLTTLYHGDMWKDVTPENYVATKNRFAKAMIEEFEKVVGVSVTPYIEEIEVASPVTLARYTDAYNGSIYGYEITNWDSVIPRLMMIKDEEFIKGLKFAGGFAFRCHGYASSLLSGETAALLTVKEALAAKQQ